ncbi:hypothetical protein D3C71_2226080 [compost metagenome]
MDEKEILVQQCEQELEIIQRLLTDAVSLSAELETMEVDIIASEDDQYISH